VYRVLLIRFASDMGLTLDVIKLFHCGLRDNAPVGPPWRKMAHRKIKEVEETIRRSRRLRSLLEHLLQCHGASLQVCAEHLRLSPRLCSSAIARGSVALSAANDEIPHDSVTVHRVSLGIRDVPFNAK
jgi:hypothetical protein